MTISFTVPCVPVPQPRPRAVSRGNHASVYNPTSIKTAEGRKPHPIVEFKAAVRYCAMQAYQGPPLTGPLSMRLRFELPRPKSMIWKKKEMLLAYHTGPKDIDNMAKAVMDALNKLLYVDDGQVCELQAEKLIVAGGEQPHVYVYIEEIDCTEL